MFTKKRIYPINCPIFVAGGSNGCRTMHQMRTRSGRLLDDGTGFKTRPPSRLPPNVPSCQTAPRKSPLFQQPQPGPRPRPLQQALRLLHAPSQRLPKKTDPGLHRQPRHASKTIELRRLLESMRRNCCRFRVHAVHLLPAGRAAVVFCPLQGQPRLLELQRLGRVRAAAPAAGVHAAEAVQVVGSFEGPELPVPEAGGEVRQRGSGGSRMPLGKHQQRNF